MSDYEQRSDGFKQLVDDVRDMKDCLRDVKIAVIGDQEYGQDGLVSRMKAMELWRRNLDIRIASMSGGILVAGFVVKYFLTGKL